MTSTCKHLSVYTEILVYQYVYIWTTQLGSTEGKASDEMWETWVWSMGWEDPLEKEMVTHSSILAWRIPWTEEPGGLQSTGSPIRSIKSIHICVTMYIHMGFPASSVVKDQFAMQEMQVQPLGQKDLLEKEMATHSSILAWEIPWTGETDRP